jgi:hypothetical protein
MQFPSTEVSKQVHSLATKLDYAIRMSGAKSILMASDEQGEGKTSALATCAPVLAELYGKKILVLNMSTESFEKNLSLKNNKNIMIVNTSDLDFLNDQDEQEKTKRLNTYINEMSESFDQIFININTLRRAEKTKLPDIKIDGAVIIRSEKSLGQKIKPITEDILDREIPILGLIYNEGA